MGKIHTQEQSNKNTLLEIIYGGDEAPFGGVDTSAPPMYIDPTCFIDASGFVIVNEQLVAVGWDSVGPVAINDFPAGAVVLGTGSFYSNTTYNNFLLAYKQTSSSIGPPPSATLTYYLWVWQAGNNAAVSQATSLAVTQYRVDIAATPAIAFLLYGGAVALTAGNVALTVGGVLLNIPINIGDTPLVVAENVVAAVNGAAGYPCTAQLLTNGQIELTTTATGAATNLTTLTVVMSGTSVATVSVGQKFAYGQDLTEENFSLPILPLSWVAIGESLYFGGAGTMILEYNNAEGANVLSVLTQYIGAVFLNKFNGQLIAAGIVPGPGQNIQVPEMIVGWSAPNALGTWNPVDQNGFVTGAGFNEIADIADYITGILIANSMAIVLRGQGLDYITALQNSTIPFDFNHISNAKRGEGCQDGRLVTQYDQIGLFVGNSDIYEFSGSLSTIGAKIKNLLLTNAQMVGINRYASSACLQLAGDQNTFAFIIVDYIVYMYCFNNKTWMKLNVNLPVGTVDTLSIEPWAVSRWLNLGKQFVNNFQMTAVYTPIPGQAPSFWGFDDVVQNVDTPFGEASFVIFKQEEIAFGRDITIDGLLVSLAASPGQVLEWSISGVLHATQVIPMFFGPNQLTTYQISFNEAVKTVQNPQLRLDIPLSAAGIKNTLVIAKIGMYGSFDPTQRPV